MASQGPTPEMHRRFADKSGENPHIQLGSPPPRFSVRRKRSVGQQQANASARINESPPAVQSRLEAGVQEVKVLEPSSFTAPADVAYDNAGDSTIVTQPMAAVVVVDDPPTGTYENTGEQITASVTVNYKIYYVNEEIDHPDGANPELTVIRIRSVMAFVFGSDSSVIGDVFESSLTDELSARDEYASFMLANGYAEDTYGGVFAYSKTGSVDLSSTFPDIDFDLLGRQLNRSGTETNEEVVVGYGVEYVLPPSIGSSTIEKNVFGGRATSVVVRDDGVIWVSGEVGNGEAGTGFEQPYHSVATPATELSSIKWLHSSWASSAAVRLDGEIWVWGEAMGNDATNMAYPQKVEGFGDVVAAWVVPQGGLIARKQDGSTWASTTVNSIVGLGTEALFRTPTQLDEIANVESISGFQYSHTAALLDDGSVWLTGDSFGGLFADTPHRFARVESFTNIVEIASGYSCIFARNSAGEVFFLGFNESGQCGVPSVAHNEWITEPLKIPLPAAASGLAASEGSGFALDEEGRVWGWGGGWYGELNPDYGSAAEPINLNFPKSQKIAAATYGSVITLAEDCSIWGKGANWSYQLGDGTTEDRFQPVQMLTTDPPGGVYEPSEVIVETYPDFGDGIAGVGATEHSMTDEGPTGVTVHQVGEYTTRITSAPTVSVREWSANTSKYEVVASTPHEHTIHNFLYFVNDLGKHTVAFSNALWLKFHYTLQYKSGSTGNIRLGVGNSFTADSEAEARQLAESYLSDLGYTNAGGVWSRNTASVLTQNDSKGVSKEIYVWLSTSPGNTNSYGTLRSWTHTPEYTEATATQPFGLCPTSCGVDGVCGTEDDPPEEEPLPEEPPTLPPMEPEPESFDPRKARRDFNPGSPPFGEFEPPMDMPPLDPLDEFAFDDMPFFPEFEEFPEPSFDPCNFGMPDWGGSDCGPPEFGGGEFSKSPQGPTIGGPGGVTGGSSGKFFQKKWCKKNILVTEAIKQLAAMLDIAPERIITRQCNERWTGCFEKGYNIFDALKKLAKICGMGVVDDGDVVEVKPIRPNNRHHYLHEDLSLFTLDRVYDNQELYRGVEVFRPADRIKGVPYRAVLKKADILSYFDNSEAEYLPIVSYDYSLTENQIQNLANFEAGKRSGAGAKLQAITFYDNKYKLYDQLHIQKPSMGWFSRWMIVSRVDEFTGAEGGAHLTTLQATWLGGDARPPGEAGGRIGILPAPPVPPALTPEEELMT